MEFIQTIQDINATLQEYVWFRSLKFVLALYLLVMFVSSILHVIGLYRKGYFTVLSTGQEFPIIPKGSYLEYWKGVVARLQSPTPNEWKVAVIEAAELVDKLLTTIKYPGDSLGAKLEGMNDNQISNLEEVKEAVNLRNTIVQEADYDLKLEEAKDAVVAFGKALQFFEAI